MNDKFYEDDGFLVIYVISMVWFKDWENFVRGKFDSKFFYLLFEYVIEKCFILECDICICRICRLYFCYFSYEMLNIVLKVYL